MTTFLNDTNPKCNQSSTVIGKTKYLLTKRAALEGDGYVFTVDEPNHERLSILLTSNEARALFFLMSTNRDDRK